MKIPHPTWLKMFFGVLIATSVFTLTANAHSSFAGKFTLPFEVHWGRAVLPAGQYFISMDATTGPAMVSSMKGDKTIYTEAPAVANSHSGGTSLTITTTANERRVRYLNVRELGKLLIFAPRSKSEREELAKTVSSNTIPVVTAKN